MVKKEVLLIVGTRPEAVKAAPVALALAGPGSDLRPVIVHSGQHDGMVEQALHPFGLYPNERLTIRRANGSQSELFAELMPKLDRLIARRRPSAVVVQGDTSTALAGALCAFWRSVPVAHLEAGLRTGDLRAPFPEEANRQLIARVAALHLAPTQAAAHALNAESLVHNDIVVTGNTVVDAARIMATAGLPPAHPDLVALQDKLSTKGGRLVLLTMHRRENWGSPLADVLSAVTRLTDRHPDIHVVVPAHPNPWIRVQVHDALGGHPAVTITEPLAYPDLVWALRHACLVLTDSGGIQEEAPSFGVPVLVLREVTERMEAVEAGCAWLVGHNTDRLLAEAERILLTGLRVPLAANPFGDGYAAQRVCAALSTLAVKDMLEFELAEALVYAS